MENMENMKNTENMENMENMENHNLEAQVQHPKIVKALPKAAILTYLFSYVLIS